MNVIMLIYDFMVTLFVILTVAIIINWCYCWLAVYKSYLETWICNCSSFLCYIPIALTIIKLLNLIYMDSGLNHILN